MERANKRKKGRQEQRNKISTQRKKERKKGWQGSREGKYIMNERNTNDKKSKKEIRIIINECDEKE